MRSLMVGSVWRISRLTAVAAPVRVEENTSDDSAVTVTSSAMVAWLRVSTRSFATPRLTTTSFTVCERKPVRLVVTV